MHTLPDPCVAPGAEVAPHCGPGWKLMRQGSPLAACTIQVQNGIDHFSDISCSWVSTWLGGWDERFEDGPFLLRQITDVAESFHCSTSSIFPFFFCFSIPLYTQPLIPIPFLCGIIKENRTWKGMNIIHGTSNHPSGLASIGRRGQGTHENGE